MNNMRGDTNFKGSDSSDPSVYFLCCAKGKVNNSYFNIVYYAFQKKKNKSNT